MLRKQFFEKYKEVDLPLPMTPIAQDKPFDFRKLEKKNGICHSLGY
ncbi:hypothetical protein RUM_01780 [Ruminococcus champanellensis 18P13 = JCM 17042]|uniref:Uncharacterized protein n=1 Tax=Ruminococcus champanellensis (strain DSM 18848 / JCM 17042 / KCTC 15320 / 18P13) TaxID=213810 RepID=D4L9Y8_RUMC1|nr:hypothetical protein RUM_01780 [Ruminococcus champanellensis 18P13 = JCM 17042]